MQTLSLIVVVLIIAGYFVSPPPPPGFSTTFVVLNRFGAMVALMVIVWLAASYRHKVAEQASSLADEQRKQDQFQALVESLPVQIWTATPTGEIDYVGQKLEQFAG
ncbi:hypothetical protein [Pseudidiomarina mangrovi]|uniref:hypothetical protein n=1 Tax=Pseudidiomarina mangrovi TaxID=2487133 RepID=UPI000FCB3E80|nr:hypothetical protein [Pseudidiomarina mangrovi]